MPFTDKWKSTNAVYVAPFLPRDIKLGKRWTENCYMFHFLNSYNFIAYMKGEINAFDPF